jgi:hypothetical protein
MASTTFSFGTVITSTWLNDVNTAVFDTIPNLAPLTGAVLQSPTLVSPTIGNATVTSINKNAFTQPTTNCTWTLADGKTLTVSNTITLNGTDGATLTLGSGASSVSGTNTGDQLTFKTISVAGQSDVVADTASDTLTLVAGTGVTLTTDPATDTVTIGAVPGAGSGSMALLATATVSSTVATIDFLNVFNPSQYNTYIVTLTGMQSNTTAGALRVTLAKAGVLDNATNYTLTNTDGAAQSTGQGPFNFGNSYMVSGTIHISNTAATNGTPVVVTATTASYNGTNYIYTGRGGNYVGGAVTGFSLVAPGGSWALGTVRVYGIKNT